MKRVVAVTLLICAGLWCLAQAQEGRPVGPNPPCSAFGTASGQCAQGGVITAGGPTGGATTVPVITYNAAGQLTAVSTASTGVTSVGTATVGQIPGTTTNDNATAGNIGETADSVTPGSTATVTFTNSSPSIGWTAHGLNAGSLVHFTNSGGALPTNFAINTPYYVIATGLSANAFEVSATYGGSAIVAGSAGSGTQTGLAESYQGTNLTAQDVAGLTLSAGDWDCSGSIVATDSGSTTAFALYMNTASNTFPSAGNRYRASQISLTLASGGTFGVALPPQRFSVATTQNVFIGQDETFSAGTSVAVGQIHCRRMR